MRVQHFLLFPVLLFARISWCLQSLSFPMQGKLSRTAAVAEMAALGLHYAWLGTVALAYLSVPKARPPQVSVIVALTLSSP